MLRIKIEAILKSLTMEHIFAFAHARGLGEASEIGWSIYDPVAELKRMSVRVDGIGGWLVDVQSNADYQLSPTYPAILALPSDMPAGTLAAAGFF